MHSRSDSGYHAIQWACGVRRSFRVIYSTYTSVLSQLFFFFSFLFTSLSLFPAFFPSVSSGAFCYLICFLILSFFAILSWSPGLALIFPLFFLLFSVLENGMLPAWSLNECDPLLRLTSSIFTMPKYPLIQTIRSHTIRKGRGMANCKQLDQL